MNHQRAQNERRAAGEIRNLVTWLSVAPFVLLVLILIGHAGMASAQVPERADTRSRVLADYQPWSPVVIHPVDARIADEVRLDQTRFPELFELPATAAVQGSIYATPSSTAAPPPTSAFVPTQNPSQTSQPSGTPAVAGAATPAATSTWTPTRTATTAATSVGTTPPSPTPTRTPSATRTSSAIPTGTRTPTAPPTWMPTSTPTRTPAPTSTPTRTPAPTSTPTRTPTSAPAPTATATSAPLGHTYWFYDDTSPYRYMMYPSPPSGEGATFATDLANGTVEFYTDLFPASTSIQAGTTIVYINAYTPSLNSSYGVWRLFAGRAGSWTELGYGQMGLPFFTAELLQVSFPTAGYVFGAGEQLMLVLEADQYLEITWDGFSGTSRLEIP